MKHPFCLPEKPCISFPDANILVLLIAGQVRPTIVPQRSHRELIGLTLTTSEVLSGLFAQFDATITTPYILAEVNTLLSRLDNNSMVECRAKLAEYIPNLENRYTQPKDLAASNRFPNFGISDVRILFAPDQALVLTQDCGLIGLLQKQCDVLDYSAVEANNSRVTVKQQGFHRRFENFRLFSRKNGLIPFLGVNTVARFRSCLGCTKIRFPNIPYKNFNLFVNMKQKLVIIASVLTLVLSATPDVGAQWVQTNGPTGQLSYAFTEMGTNLFTLTQEFSEDGTGRPSINRLR